MQHNLHTLDRHALITQRDRKRVSVNSTDHLVCQFCQHYRCGLFIAPQRRSQRR